VAITRLYCAIRASYNRGMLTTTERRFGKDSCPEDGKNASIKVRVLHDACLKLGGEAHLAEYLDVAVRLVDSWLKGRGVPPDEIFLKCLDLLEQP
jgi:hypothetical protein